MCPPETSGRICVRSCKFGLRADTYLSLQEFEETMTLSLILILITCGILANFMSALFGIGGGVLMVPVLHTLFPDLPFQMISATSLTIVMGTALINLSYFWRQKLEISYKAVAVWSVGMLIGVQIGFESSFYLPKSIMVGVFIGTLVLLSIRTLFFYNIAKKTDERPRYELPKGAFLCSLGGLIAGMTGIGGGSVMAPLIAQLRSVKPAQIAVYSNYLMVIGGLGSLFGYLTRTPETIVPNSWQIGYVNFSVVALVVFSSFLTSFFSMKVKGKLSPEITQKLLSVVLLVIAGYMAILQCL